MPRLTELYVATRTRNVENAGTDHPPVLLVSRAGQDLFQVPLDLDMAGMERGKASLNRLDVADLALDSEDLEFRLLAGGDDAWALEDAIAWGIAGRLPRLVTVPLAALLGLASAFTPASGGTWLSTDTDEGVASVALRPVTAGTRTLRAWRLIVIAVTEPHAGFEPGGGPGPSVGEMSDVGTAGPLTLQAGGPGRLLLSYTIPRTPQGDLGVGNANFYITDLAAPFSRADVEGGQFTLTLESSDWWVPDYFAVFGIDTTFGQPNALIPFVHAPAISLERMSADTSEGWHTNGLPTALVPPPSPVLPPTVIGGLVDAVAARMASGDKGGRSRVKTVRITPKRADPRRGSPS